MWCSRSAYDSGVRRVESFDVFDTLITRRVADPTTVFIFVARRARDAGLIALDDEQFASLRGDAERWIHDQHGREPSSLSEIYRVMCARNVLPATLAEDLARLETEVERSMIVPVPGAARSVDEARSNGQVVFLSDMYLSSSFIGSALSELGLRQDEPVLVSGEIGASKQRGDAYPLLAEHFGVEVARIHHRGDNRIADHNRALAAGASATLITDARANRYERTLEAHRSRTRATTSLIAGASRLARLSTSTPDEHHTELANISAGVGAPLLTAYVSWALRRAQFCGLRRLYFVARDGEVMLTFARRLDAVLGTGIDLRYLHGSRVAWTPALIRPDRIGDDLRTLVDRIGFSRELILRFGFDPDDWLPGRPAEPTRTGAPVRATPSVDSFVEAASPVVDHNRQLLEAYLGGQGLRDPVPIGLVDSGWNGHTIRAVIDLVSGPGLPERRALLMGCNLHPDHDERLDTWWYGPGPPEHGRFKISSSLHTFVESFLPATHGQTVGYEPADSGPPTPRFAERSLEARRRWGIGTIHATYEAYLDHLLDAADDIDLSVDLRAAAIDCLAQLYFDPSRSEADAWGSYPVEFAAHGDYSEFARPRTLRETLLGRRPPHYSEQWAAGSRARSSTAWSVAFSAQRHAARARRVGRRTWSRMIQR